MQAVILAAGFGLRLRPFTEHNPKGLVPVLGKPLLAWTLERLPQNVDEIIIVTGWLGEKISTEFGSSHNNRPIHYATQNPINGTGFALRSAKNMLSGTFLVVNGDDLYTADDLESLSQEHWAMLATSTTKPVPGALTVTDSGIITSIDADLTENEKWQNCGAYVMNTDFFSLPLVEIPVRDKIEYSLRYCRQTNWWKHWYRGSYR
jgi:NDP-sugar pyrophosphorylase family protein